MVIFEATPDQIGRVRCKRGSPLYSITNPDPCQHIYGHAFPLRSIASDGISHPSATRRALQNASRQQIVSLEARFLELLPAIDRLTRALGRRRGLDGAEADDFAALVRARFVESDYAPLRQYRGDASINTYLAVIISSWLKDYLIARDGRWRPSAAALKAGPVAVMLERLITKGRRSVDEAVAELLAGNDQPYSERELQHIARSLPRREPLRPMVVSSDEALKVASDDSGHPDTHLRNGDRDLSMARARRALERAMQALDPEDRVLVAMRFLDGLSVAEVARALNLEQKPLYRRLHRSLSALRRQLETTGVTRETVQEILGASDS